MDHQSGAEVAEQLNRANDCANRRWRLWSYAPTDKALVLCGSGEEFQYTGFLLFSGTLYINVPWSINEPLFKLAEVVNPAAVTGDPTDLDHHLIEILSGKDRFCVLSREVRFLTISESKQPLGRLLGVSE
jgi:hypothetical protein